MTNAERGMEVGWMGQQEMAGRLQRGELEPVGELEVGMTERPEMSPPHVGDTVEVDGRPFRIQKQPVEVGASGGQVAWRVEGRYLG